MANWSLFVSYIYLKQLFCYYFGTIGGKIFSPGAFETILISMTAKLFGIYITYFLLMITLWFHEQLYLMFYIWLNSIILLLDSVECNAK